jgi:hypothetical protein
MEQLHFGSGVVRELEDTINRSIRVALRRMVHHVAAVRNNLLLDNLANNLLLCRYPGNN